MLEQRDGDKVLAGNRTEEKKRHRGAASLSRKRKTKKIDSFTIFRTSYWLG